MAADAWPTLFIPHGGGPCFFMDPPPSWPRDTWDRMAAFFCGIDASLGWRPAAAVLVVSGHWEASRPTLNIASRPELLFDYYAFRPTPTSCVIWSRARRRWPPRSARC